MPELGGAAAERGVESDLANVREPFSGLLQIAHLAAVDILLDSANARENTLEKLDFLSSRVSFDSRNAH